MTENRIYVEGGGGGKYLRSRCREGFHKLLENAGFKGKVPRIVASGSRNETYEDFKTANGQSKTAYVAMLVDSEDPVSDTEKCWEHLRQRDKWVRPAGATEEQVFLMTTCMETWIIADRATLRNHFGSCLQESALPPTNDLEGRDRHNIQDKLVHATRKCKNAYAKNERSFEILAKLSPDALLDLPLPAFGRMVRILKQKL